MMIKRILTISVLLISFSLFISFSLVKADELSEIEKKLNDLKQAMEMSKKATVPLESNLTRLEASLKELQMKIIQVEEEVIRKEKEVKEGEESLVIQQGILEQRVRSFYKNSRLNVSASLLLFSKKSGLGDILRLTTYRKSVIDEDKKIITEIVLYVRNLEIKKKQLEQEKIRLAVVKTETDKQAEFLKKEITGAKKYQEQLSNQIAQLSKRQQDLLAQKLAGLNLPSSLGAGPLYCTDDRKIDPGFSPAFAFFTYGIPHRVGLNQYGALGRAKAGQNYKDILRAYFDNIDFQKRDQNMKIKVQGYGEKALDEYLLGIYEMPGNWPLEALKAQVVAARSYALSYTNNGANEICTTQACQVYKGGNKGGDWERAVRDTEGEVMVSGGEVIKGWYASTFGGYAFTSGDVWGSNKPWTKRMRDTSGDINSFSDLLERAYDKESPCFYAAQGFRSEYGKSAWLKSDEVADIVNVLLLAKNDSSVQQHLSQPDKPNPDGVDTWDKDRVKQELRNRNITPYNNISSFTVEWDKGLGRTTQINASGDAGNSNFSGDEFKNFFNLRAPANIQIVGPLYNVEKK